MKRFGFMIATLMLAAPVHAEGLPSQMKWTAFGTDSSGYAQAIAVSTMLKEHGTRVAVLPGQNDIARLAPLKNGQADYCMCGSAAFFTPEGVGDYSARDWGPQPLRLIMSRIDGTGTTYFTRGNSDVKTPADLKGKRVPFLRAGESTNIAMSAILAFAGLTRDDVEVVTYAGFSESMEGLINNEIDVHFATTVTPKAAQLASGSSGIHWIPLPHDDSDGWSRMQSIAPYLSKRNVTIASGLPEGETFEASAFAYPLFVTQVGQSEEEVYTLTKTMVENIDSYKNSAPGAEGWALEAQDFKASMPYHEGAIRYFKEVGVWTDDIEAHNQSLIARQDLLIAAWKELSATAPADDDAFKEAWLAARAKALNGAGLPLYFE